MRTLLNPTKLHRRSAGLPLAAAILLLLPLLILACDEGGAPRDPLAGDAPAMTWPSAGRTVGGIHNDILAAYHDGEADRPFRWRFREAVLRRARGDVGTDPRLIREVRHVLDGPVFDEIERRRDEAVRLLRHGHPNPTNVASMLEGWGLDPSDATDLGHTLAHVWLDDRLPAVPKAAPRSEAQAVFHDVLRNSHHYWTNRPSLAKITDDSEVVAFDALGALGGLSFGPIGAIVGGAAYSILWREVGVEEDTDDGCADCH